ncbi:Uncharacterised protein [Mycobacteroides abscessus subsp. abscessus]|nr:Uncharacterised protein [Mycobacteroides abscessus subsp. abscessus]
MAAARSRHSSSVMALSSRPRSPSTNRRTIRHHWMVKCSASRCPRCNADANSCAASSAMIAAKGSASRCSGASVSRTASFTARRCSRTTPLDSSTPCGWNWRSAARFSRLAGWNGVGASASTRPTSPGSSRTTMRRPGTTNSTGPAPNSRRNCRIRCNALLSAWAFSSRPITGRRRAITPAAMAAKPRSVSAATARVPSSRLPCSALVGTGAGERSS